VIASDGLVFCAVAYMGVGSGGQGSRASPLDFHAWYRYSRL